MKKDMGRAFGSQGPEGMEEIGEPNHLNGAKGPGMKHVVSPGAGAPPMGGGGMDEQKKHMLIMALMRAQGAGAPPMGGGAPMGGGMPMGGMQ